MAEFVGELLGSRDFADLASRIYELGSAIRAKLVNEGVPRTPSHTASIFYFARSLKTFHAAIELLRLGFWQDAAVLARVLREAQYQLAWIVAGGDETAQLFVDDYHRNRRKVLRTLAEHGDPEIKNQAQETIQGTAPDALLDEWWRNWWSKERKEGIGWLAEKLGYTAHRLEYATLSAFVHSSPALADYYFHESKEGQLILETRPGISDENREFAEVAVFSVFLAFSDTCAAFARQMGFGFESESKDINERIRRQFTQETARPVVS